jgi:acyl carrier protein
MNNSEQDLDNIGTVVKKIIHEKLGLVPEDLEDGLDFQDDLGVDSLDLIELRMEIEKRFSISIPEEQAENLNTIGSLITFVKEKKK